MIQCGHPYRNSSFRFGRSGPALVASARSVLGAEIKNPSGINCLTFDFEPQGRKYKAVNPTGDFNKVYGFCADKEKSCDTAKSKVSKYIVQPNSLNVN